MKLYKAFSLTELAIVLAIIALISSASLSVATSKTDVYKLEQTKNKLNILEIALADFVKINYRLPCPATVTLNPTSSNYGIEQCSSTISNTIAAGSLPSGYNCTTASVNNITGGMIPFKTLNLPKEFGIDGWGNKIMYNVTQGLSNDPNVTSITYNDNFAYCNMGLITVYGPGSSSRATGAAYTIISYGANGYYGYPETGSVAKVASSNIDEQKNGIIASQTYLQAEPNGNFDDIVRYKMRWQIIREAGAVVETTACVYAKQILETSDLTSNVAYFNPYCTAQPSSPDCESAIYTLSNFLNKKLCLLK